MAQPKGRPTPKRSEVRAARRTPVVGAKPVAKSSARASMREAMRTGDERNYPAVAAGPERAAVRDAVDGRRSFGWLALPGWLVGVTLTLVPSEPVKAAGALVFPFVIAVLVVDAVAAARAVRAALAERWPEGTAESRRALVTYGVLRNTQFRRQRLPKPKVWRGRPVP